MFTVFRINNDKKGIGKYSFEYLHHMNKKIGNRGLEVRIVEISSRFVYSRKVKVVSRFFKLFKRADLRTNHRFKIEEEVTFFNS